MRLAVTNPSNGQTGISKAGQMVFLIFWPGLPDCGLKGLSVFASVGLTMMNIKIRAFL